jgi:Alpha-glutamyl/putrescinyl thymine pyrophosphorylase clade 2
VVDISTVQAFEDFGRALIQTEDLDPLYVGVYRAQLNHKQLSAFLLTYWMFYNAGFAAETADHYDAYWDQLKAAVATKATRRGTERRHFRGARAIQAVDTLSGWYPTPADALSYLTDGNHAIPFLTIMDRAQKWPLFGPWIGFKIADMLDRCGYCQVDSEGCDLAMYNTPVKGAQLYAQLSGGSETPTSYAVLCLEQAYRGLRAPPARDRPIGIYEVETVLCKVKSAANGHYYVGKDTIEIREMLSHNMATSPTSRRIYSHMPPVELL